MILDSQSQFSTGQAITATALSSNVMDLRGSALAASPTTEDEGLTGANESWVEVRALTAAAGGDAAKTLTITLESALDAGLSSSPVVHYSSSPILGAAIVAGAVLMRVPVPSGDMKRYLGLRYTVSAGFTAFSVYAGMVVGVDARPIYPGNFVVR